jgi:hypothetical protein
MKEVAERMKVPRALHTAFPVGRSLGKPGDKQFQHEVLRAAFSLLNESNGPVIREFPRSISSTGGEPLVCSLPPRMDTELHPAVDEARALKQAYDRASEKNGRTSVGMQISAGQVPDALERFVRIVDGEHWDEVGFPAGSMYGTVHDIRAYYEELACELAEGPIEPWATEEWFYDGTEAGRLILEARRAMRDREADQAIWFGLAPAGRP